MLIDNESPYLYNLTLKPPSNYPHSVIGQFIPNSKQQQLALISSCHLSLLTADPETGKLSTRVSQNLFAVVNAVDKLRFNDYDVLVLTSDSGNLSIIQYDSKRNEFVSTCQMPMCKNGWNRSYPGEFLAVDLQSRCILVGAVEKSKLLYKVESSADKLELSSPLESVSVVTRGKQPLVCLALISLETVLGNPLFAALEFDNEQQVTLLNYYEFDQGMNHVIRRKSKVNTVPNDANYLVPVPGTIGGVLVCGENWIMYDMLGLESIVLPLPRRENQNSIVANHVTHVLKKKSYGFFILLQTDLGDLFRLIIDYDSDRELIKDIEITYFDTIPVCYSLNIFKNGLCFANCINRNQLLYQFEKLGEELDEDIRINCTIQSDDIPLTKEKVVEFKLKGLDNLALIDVVESLSPITDSALTKSGLVTLSTKSKLKNIVHGTPTTTLVESPLPITPTKIFTAKTSAEAVDDEYLVITSTLSYKTLVLSIGEVIEEVTDSKFVLDQPTVAVQQVGKSSIVQVYSNGVRHVNGKKKVTNWYPPAGITITHATTNNQQILIGMSNLELVYFATDAADDQLIEYQDRLEVSSPIRSMCISKEQSSSFAVVGCSDETIQVISLQQQSCLEVKSLQALSSSANSLVMLTHNPSTTLIHIGMHNGVYVRTKIDTFNGRLSDTRIKYLGPKSVTLSELKLSDDITGVLAISSKPWIGYYHQGKYRCTPLLDIDIINGASFKSEDIGGGGIVGIHGDNLVIFSVGKEDSVFDPTQELTVTEVDLRYLPRKVIGGDNDDEGRLFVSEVEMGIKTPYTPNLTKEVRDVVDREYHEAFGYERGPGCASCVQLIQNGQVIQSLEFLKNQRIVDMTKISFNKNSYLVVGVITGEENLLYTFKIDKKKNFQYIHKTELKFVPQVMEVFQDRLLVASGNAISLYDLGQRQLLRKSLTRIDFMQTIVKVSPQPNQRVLLADSAKSIVLAKFDNDENQFIAVADDVVKRNITAWKQLDYDTVIGGDKFGNIFVSRLDREQSRQVDQDWTVLKQTARDSPNLNSCVFKLQTLCQYYIPDIITSFSLGSFNLGGEECIIYTGITGTIGVLIPLISKTEVELMHNLKLAISAYNDQVNVAGKNHAKLRSYYNPVKNVFDGDFMELYLNLPLDVKLTIAKRLNKSVGEVEKKLNDVRNRSSF
ncbi:RSE1 [Candida margitis]|uniref:RSE1 n=1 Tax=Candida margitis TaxID=1775924 RepID=UPI002227169B|nr:RSE1 [Candida margitis]KAI5967274.1 RSE1 [Candida margitis]